MFILSWDSSAFYRCYPGLLTISGNIGRFFWRIEPSLEGSCGPVILDFVLRFSIYGWEDGMFSKLWCLPCVERGKHANLSHARAGLLFKVVLWKVLSCSTLLEATDHFLAKSQILKLIMHRIGCFFNDI